MIVGTSVGSLNGGILALGYKVSDLAVFFDKDAPEIFPTGLNGWFHGLRSLTEAEYDPQKLIDAIRSIIGDALLNACKVRFVATSFDCLTGKIITFDSGRDSYETPEEIVIGRDSGIMMWQVMLASAAAQKYFPAFEFTLNGRTYRCLDGGNTGRNATAALALDIASETTAYDQIVLLDVGAGRPAWKWNYPADPEIVQVLEFTTFVPFYAPEQASRASARRRLGSDRYISVDACFGQADPAIDDPRQATFQLEEAAWQEALKEPRVQMQLAQFIPAVPADTEANSHYDGKEN